MKNRKAGLDAGNRAPSSRLLHPQQGASAFTATELVVLLGCLVFLILLQFSLLAGTRGQGNLAYCFSNHRQMSLAWLMFADENHGRLVGNLDGGGVQNIGNSNQTWVLGWFNFLGGSFFPPESGGLANTNTMLLTTFSPLAPYLGRQADPFKCPEDDSLSFGTRGAPRVRSISMNAYLGPRGGPFSSGYRQFPTLSDIVRNPPSKTFVFIDERPDSINDGWFPINMAGHEPEDPARYIIVDYPAKWHNNGANLSFADGHVENWKWHDPRTMPAYRQGMALPLNLLSPGNEDVARLQGAASHRIVQ
jgi:prepilin-type processing-associated H-X9-DG protein